jgi:hypothetical protein
MKTMQELIFDSLQGEDLHQITLDFIESASEIFDYDAPLTADRKVNILNSFFNISYDLTAVLDIFNPELKKDLDMLKDLETLINIRTAYIDSIDF